MKCPKCGYNSFEHLSSCKKCGNSLSSFKDSLGIRPLIFSSAIAAAPDAKPVLHEEAPPVSPSAEYLPEDDIFQWDTSATPTAAPVNSPGDLSGLSLDTAAHPAPGLCASDEESAPSLKQEDAGQAQFEITFPEEPTAETVTAFPANPSEPSHTAIPQPVPATDSVFSAYSFEEPATPLGAAIGSEIDTFEQAWSPGFEDDENPPKPDTSHDIFGEFSTEQIHTASPPIQGGTHTAPGEFEFEGFPLDEPGKYSDKGDPHPSTAQGVSDLCELESLLGEIEQGEKKP